MAKKSFIALVRSGKCHFLNPAAFSDHVRSFEGNQILFTIGEIQENRSVAQNNYIHAICADIAREGFVHENPEVVYEWHKVKFNPKYSKDPDSGEIVVTGGSLAALSKKEFSEKLDIILSYWLGHGLTLRKHEDIEK